jgi:quercetin dioxygenase-like cupin family protein
MEPMKKNLDQPDEARSFGKGNVKVVKIANQVCGRAVFEPGWRWSEHVKPIAKTESCQVHHNGYVLSGRMKLVMDDGREAEVGPGDFFVCPPGHDAWVIGDEACVALDFSSEIAGYAKSA